MFRGFLSYVLVLTWAMLRNRPMNDDETPWPDGHRGVTFVGRPFPLEEAPEHFSRLRRWGLTFSMLNYLWWIGLILMTRFSSIPGYMGGSRARWPVRHHHLLGYSCN
jgi:hypothetical protein